MVVVELRNHALEPVNQSIEGSSLSAELRVVPRPSRSLVQAIPSAGSLVSTVAQPSRSDAKRR